jgi:RNA polymerase sigma-70 factor (ECF subfamily)
MPLAGGGLHDLGNVLDEERPYLMAIADQELGRDLRSKGGASDIVQETFLEAVRDLHLFSGKSRFEFRGWLRQILLHNILNFHRRFRGTTKRNSERELSSDSNEIAAGTPARDPTPSRVAMHAELATAVQRAIAALPSDYRAVIELRSLQRLSFEDVARRMERSAEAVRKLWCRAIEKLQDELTVTGHEFSGIRRISL